MPLSPMMVDYLIITGFEIFKTLLMKDKIEDGDLRLETFDDTLAKVKKLKEGE